MVTLALVRANQVVIAQPTGTSAGLTISGLSVAEAVVGQPVQVIFTASETAGDPFATRVDSEVGGLVATSDGHVVAKFNPVDVPVGLTTDLQNGASKFVSLNTIGTLPQQYAGSDISGSVVTAYVGGEALFYAYSVGDVFAPTGGMLQASITATGYAPPFPGSGGNPPSTTPPSTTPPSTTPPSTTPPSTTPPGQHQAAPADTALYWGIGAGALLLFGGVWWATSPGR